MYINEMLKIIFILFQVTANHSISLAQFDYTVEFEEEYREAIASGKFNVSHHFLWYLNCVRR